MRYHHATLLALPAALLATYASAVPSTPQNVINDFPPIAPRPTSAWRRLSDTLIATIWPPHQDPDRAGYNAKPKHKAPQHLPGHTLAQYGNDVVLRFNVSSADEVQSLNEAADTLLLDIWEFSKDWVDIRLAEDLVSSLLGLLPVTLHHAHVPLLRGRELARAVFETYPSPKSNGPASSKDVLLPHRQFSPALQPPSSLSTDSNVFFSDYQPLSVLIPWMKLLSSLFTTHTRLVHIGKSAEGRDIHALRIGVHPTNRQETNQPKRKTVLIIAGIHAREWIGTSTATYIAYGLITGYGKSAQITSMLEAFDFLIVPTANPDGYAYTWETDRLWRKNRQSTPLRFCQGLDLDHSFGFAWDGDATNGNACSESYAGERPFQAAEAKQIANWAKNETEENNVEFVSFIDLHSYSEQILYPYGYTCQISPPGLEDLEELAYGLGKAIRVSHGHEYEVMSACEGNTAVSARNNKKKILPFMESPGGSALDYFYHDLRVRWSYQIKLRDRGTYGFLLPREHIVPTGKEILDATLYLGSFLMEIYGATNVSKNDVKLVKGGVEEVASKQDERNVEVDDDNEKVSREDIEHIRQEERQWDLRRRRR